MQGYRVTVERSTQRIFPIDEYERVGCDIVGSHHWTRLSESRQHTAETVFILGLKDLPEGGKVYHVSSNGNGAGVGGSGEVTIPTQLSQRHIFFAHCYKGQANWRDVLSRFTGTRGGELLDLEFLQYDNGRRIAAFGNAAGFAGMALGLLQWATQRGSNISGSSGGGGHEQQIDRSLVEPYASKSNLIERVRKELSKAGDVAPRVLVLGALGRCGRGSVEMARAVGADVVEWDLEETRSGGPFPQLIEDCDILVNDIYLSPESENPPFVTLDMIKQADSDNRRRLTVFVDVSCDIGNPKNPFPLIDDVTTFERPAERVTQQEGQQKPLDVIAIDHLPTLIPAESSADFSGLLVEHLQHLHEIDFDNAAPTTDQVQISDSTTEFQRVWLRARGLFAQKVRELDQE